MIYDLRIATAAIAVLFVVPESSLLALEGRIAYSADGNQHDVDDWASTPMSLAIIDAFGAKNQLVHFDYNSHLGNNHAFMAEQQTRATLTAAECYGYNTSVFLDDQQVPRAAVASLRDAVNASSEADPLWLIIAGPAEIAYQGLRDADADKRQFVTCISHSSWNNDHSDDPPHHEGGAVVMTHTRADIEALEVKWIQIASQDSLYPRRDTPQGRITHWDPFLWLKTSKDPRLNFLFHQMEVTSKPDVSDAGMTYYLFTDNQQVTPEDLRRLLDKVDEVIPWEPCPSPVNEFEEVDGIVAVEAEHWHRLEKTEKRRWYLRVPRHYVESGADPDGRSRKHGFPFVPHAPDASGQAYLEVGPDTRALATDRKALGENTADRPGEMCIVCYRVFFNHVGRYRVWVRANSTNDYDNSLYVGLDDWANPTSELDVEPSSGGWSWSCRRGRNGSSDADVILEIKTPGFHEIMFSMKDDGFELDKFVMELTAHGVNRPHGTGPSERIHSQ